MKPAMPAYFSDLLAEQTPPCISIYMPTEKATPPAAQNRRNLRDLIDQAHQEMSKALGSQDCDRLLKKAADLLEEEAFWQHPSEGLAIFSSPTTFHAIHLPRAVPLRVEVADSFHLKPLIRAQQFTGRFQVLCLNQRNVRLLEGNQDELASIKLNPRVPTSVAEALDKPLTENFSQANRLIGSPDAHQLPESVDPHVAATTVDLEHFFRILDERIWAYHSRNSGLPLMICAVERYHELFRRISKNPNLMTEGIHLNPDSLELSRLEEEAWKIIEPYYRQQIQGVIDNYGLARSRQQGSEDVEQVAQAAAFAKVSTLLVDADKQIGGRLHSDSGRVEFGDLSQPDFDDLLDDIAEQVMKTGGQVLVMPHDQMPADTGVAAIYRF